MCVRSVVQLVLKFVVAMALLFRELSVMIVGVSQILFASTSRHLPISALLLPTRHPFPSASASQGPTCFLPSLDLDGAYSGPTRLALSWVCVCAGTGACGILGSGLGLVSCLLFVITWALQVPGVLRVPYRSCCRFGSLRPY